MRGVKADGHRALGHEGHREFADTMNNEFVGMADYVSESIHDLLVDPSESLFGSGSC